MVPPARTLAQQKGAQDTKRLWFYGAVVLWGLSYIILASFSIFAVLRSQQINTKLCQTTNDNRKIIVNILNTAKQQRLETASDIFERSIIIQHYNELRVLIPPLNCSLQGGPRELEP